MRLDGGFSLNIRSRTLRLETDVRARRSNGFDTYLARLFGARPAGRDGGYRPFREAGTVDELGLSRVQFSIANLFFPGTTTIQTRACYFLLVPWMFRELERRKISSNQIANRVRQMELAINRHLRSGEDTGECSGSEPATP